MGNKRNSKVSLQNDVVKSREFFHSFLYQLTVSYFFFSPVVSDSLTLVRQLGDDCEESFTPGTDELLWWCKCGKY